MRENQAPNFWWQVWPVDLWFAAHLLRRHDPFTV